MLDVTTKARINAARDILVGKVPNPISQVQQITFALIYKFMNDMDKQNIELGGKASFFAGDLAQYAWDNLITKKIDANEALTLYSKGLEKLIKATNIPPLFRTIFKNAFIPYRDGETFKLFIKIIDEFHYSHSEKLGDAFEFLLSILGSQGDAGQFRTPRHIIDFMVELIDPKKNETLLDPACGTAGFLISAYKHIIKNNSSNYNPETDKRAFEMHAQSVTEIGYGDEDKHYAGDRLNSSEKQRLDENIIGYDISPEMVQFSLVNFYLHDCKNPKIFEYDSLTYTDKWNENADVILANPPFMTPKGGIRPHDRFGVKSNRAEVLFVDYIAEHLTKNGRAAIIVPEGVIFQSANAYKQLRQKLIDQKFLVGVISLPAGIFNPYSGVKTSILWLDRKLASKTDNIFFAKIEADGFDLGAQRRANNKNDLPAIFRAAKEYITCLEKGKSFEADAYKNVTLVAKTKIAENGDYNFSGERYIAGKVTNAKFPMVELGNEDLFRIESGGTPDSTNTSYWGDEIKWATLVDLPPNNFITLINNTERKISSLGLKNSSAKIIPENSVIVSSRATIGRVAINTVPIATNQGFKNIIIKDFSRVNPLFLAFQVTQLKEKMELLASGGTFKEISKTSFCTLQIPLPPLEVQQEIVAEIEGYQTIIDSARKIVTTYKPRIELNPDWQEVELGEICEINPKKSEISNIDSNIEVSFVPMADINENNPNFLPIQSKSIKELLTGSYTYFRNKDVLLAKVTPCFENGKAGIAKKLKNEIGFGSSEYYVLRGKEKVLPEIIYLFVTNDAFRNAGKLVMTGTGGLQRMPKEFVSKYKIPLPPLETQKQIVAEIEAEQAIINGNKKLITLFEAKIHRIIAKIWGEHE